MINVTKTFLPPITEYISYLEEIWNCGQVTNNGKFVVDLERKLSEFLNVKHVCFTSNGTLALQIALKALNVNKEVITTPFSYVATTSSILWQKCKPIFVDIDPLDYCIDVTKIEDAITSNTEAILAVHVFGHACNIEAIEKIASKHKLKIIYDAAHSFGCSINNNSLASFGDVSALSFHATKLFHTIEGGAVITNNDEIAKNIRLCRAFGHIGDEHFTLGINAKNSELHAAMGLCLLPYVPEIIAHRKKLAESYTELLKQLPIKLPPPIPENHIYNYAYYPIIFETEPHLLEVKKLLESENIWPRRYFYPSLDTLPYIEHLECRTSRSISNKILCLPMSHEIDSSIQDKISQLIKSVVKP